jgi:hypothetical protein
MIADSLILILTIFINGQPAKGGVAIRSNYFSDTMRYAPHSSLRYQTYVLNQAGTTSIGKTTNNPNIIDFHVVYAQTPYFFESQTISWARRVSNDTVYMSTNYETASFKKVVVKCKKKFLAEVRPVFNKLYRTIEPSFCYGENTVLFKKGRNIVYYPENTVIYVTPRIPIKSLKIKRVRTKAARNHRSFFRRKDVEFFIISSWDVDDKKPQWGLLYKVNP